MFDLILVSELTDCFIFDFLGFSFLFFIICKFYVEIIDDKKQASLFMKEKTVKIILAVFTMACIGTIMSIPKALLKANVLRIKIHYTSPEEVKKAEGTALKVIDKLDKLIDKNLQD